MYPDDLPLCGNCGLDEITHDHTANHDFVSVGGGRTVPRPLPPDYCPPSKLRQNALPIIVACAAFWAFVVWRLLS